MFNLDSISGISTDALVFFVACLQKLGLIIAPSKNPSVNSDFR